MSFRPFCRSPGLPKNRNWDGTNGEWVDLFDHLICHSLQMKVCCIFSDEVEPRCYVPRFGIVKIHTELKFARPWIPNVYEWVFVLSSICISLVSTTVDYTVLPPGAKLELTVWFAKLDANWFFRKFVNLPIPQGLYLVNSSKCFLFF